MWKKAQCGTMHTPKYKSSFFLLFSLAKCVEILPFTTEVLMLIYRQ